MDRQRRSWHNPRRVPLGARGGSVAQPYEYSELLKAALAVPECISFTVWGFTDSDSWVPGTFTGEGYAGIYDVNQQPKAAHYALQSDLALAAYGAPPRVHTYTPHF